MSIKNVIRFVLTGYLAATLYAQNHSVKLVRVIPLSGISDGKKVAAFFLGKRKNLRITPVSLCRVSAVRVCLTDAFNGLVVLIDNNGKMIQGKSRIKGLKLISPVSACSDGQGSIYVSDSGIGAILKFDDRLKFLGIFVAKPGTRITGIACLGDMIYGVDTANHRVLCFDLTGKPTLSFGVRGSGRGEFNFPTHIAVDNKIIYITDAMNFRVQLFTHSGIFKLAFGGHGKRGGNFSKPKGIAVDRGGRILVADAMFDNIQVFNAKGEFLSYFGGPGSGDDDFWMPSGIMVDKDDTIWITDTYNHRIKVVQLLEKGS